MKKYLILLFIIFELSFGCLANECKDEIKSLSDNWYVVTVIELIENITPEEARTKAIIKACNMAIEEFAGIEVKGRTSLIQAEANNEITMDHFSKLTNQISNGIILEKQILNEENVTSGNYIYKKVTMKIRVGKQPGEDDPFFTLDASLNKEIYQVGDEVYLEVIPSKDCYLTILNIMSDENVITLFPNKYRDNNFVEAEELFSLPNESDNQLGISLKVSLLPEKEEDTEIIKIIATKEPFRFSVDSDYKTALESLQNWIVNIPRSEIEEVDLQYFIINK